MASNPRAVGSSDRATVKITHEAAQVVVADSGASTAFLDHDVKNNVAKVAKNTIARLVNKEQIESYDVVRRTARGESTARQRLGFYGQGICDHTEAR